MTPVSRETVIRRPSANDAAATTSAPSYKSAMRAVSELPAAAATSGEAGHPAAAGCTATRHDDSRAAYRAGCRCPGAVEANRRYYRDYYRNARAIDAFRERHNEATRRSKERLRADAAARARINARNRQWAQARRQRDGYDRRYLVDPVVVERLVSGERLRANRAEKQAALNVLLGKGLTLTAAAQQLGINSQYARRYAETA